MPLGVDVVARNTVVAMIVVVDVVDWDHWVLSLVQIASVFQASEILDATHSHVREGVVEGLANGSLANLFLAEPQGNPETAETGSEGSPDVGEKTLFLREQSHDPFIAVVGCLVEKTFDHSISVVKDDEGSSDHDDGFSHCGLSVVLVRFWLRGGADGLSPLPHDVIQDAGRDLIRSRDLVRLNQD